MIGSMLLLHIYSGARILLGLLASRSVRTAADFFVPRDPISSKYPDPTASCARIASRMPAHPPASLRPGENTPLGVIATTAAFAKAGRTKIAQMGHDGLARAIRPVHRPFDGDTLFARSTGRVRGADLGLVGARAAEVVAEAVVRAVLKAESVPGYPAARDLLRASDAR